ncbi:MAG: JAB domain-containing protein [Alphaproteobacteria bacterium]|nr:MAG: JAB domain-containing protein [Alphaproteobacteria bacterium]
MTDGDRRSRGRAGLSDKGEPSPGLSYPSQESGVPSKSPAAGSPGAKSPASHDLHGHRRRLRARFLKTMGEGLADYELIELLLTGAMPRRDVKPLAKALVNTFDTYEGVLSAEPAALGAVKGMGEAGVAILKAVEVAARRLAQEKVLKKPVISNWQALLDYCRTAMAHAPREQFRVLFLDRKNVLIADEVQQEGTVDHTPVYPREVIRRALELHASAIILVHNHPSGDPTPSRADIDMTREIAEAGRKLGIRLHDHLVIGRTGHASFKTMGLL